MATTDPNPGPLARFPGWRPFIVAAVVAAAYANSLGGVFLFDDIPYINVERTYKPFPLTQFLSDPRPVTALTFALNYALGGLDDAEWQYHLLNVAVHITAALLLYGLVRRTLELPQFRGRYADAAPNLALAVAAIWGVHPLTTQAVTYIVQRGESLMGMFFLLSLYGLNRGATATGRGATVGWYAVAVAASALGMASKQVGAVIPVVALLYDRCFLAGTFRAAVAKRWWLYPALAAGLVFVLPTLRSLTLNLGGESAQPVVHSLAGTVSNLVVHEPTAWEYARTQPGVILHYLRLSVVPYPLCLDYAWEIADGPAEVYVPAVVVVGLVLASFWALWRYPAIGFLAVSFFAILAPTSSFVPITDLAFEHRMYLPLAALVTLAVVGADRALWRAETPPTVGRGLAVGVTVIFAVLTVARNEDYASDTGMWRDVAAKRPNNPRAHYNLGTLLFKDALWDEAIPVLETADRLGIVRPMTGVDLFALNNNLGTMLARKQRHADAVDRYRAALRFFPGQPDVLCNLANALVELDRCGEAADVLRGVLATHPQSPAALRGMGKALARRGDYADAVPFFERALAAAPTDVSTNNGFGVTLRRLGRYDEAVLRHQAAIAAQPNYPPSYHQLGITLFVSGKPANAATAFGSAVRLAPNDARFHGYLAAALDDAGNPRAADHEYQTTVKLSQEWPLDAGRAAWDLATSPDPGTRFGPEAVILAKQVNRVTGGQDPTALDILAASYAASGKYPEASAAAKQAIAAAAARGRHDLADQIRQRLGLYESGKPFIRPKTGAE